MLNLKNNVVLVDGKESDAIYDFNKKKLYRVNKDAGQFINSISKEEYNVENISETDKQFIKDCLSMEILSEKEEAKKTTSIEDFISNEVLSEFCWLEITSFCNQKCIHCFMADELNKKCLSYETIVNVVNGLKKLNVKTIALSGGEPTLHPEFENIVRFIHGKGINILVLTNGLTINKKLISLFKETNTAVRIPLLGLEETHNKITTVKNSFEIALENIKMLNNAKINILVTSTIMSINMDQIEQLRVLVSNLGLNFDASPIFPIGNAKKNWNDIKPKNYQNLLNACNGCDGEYLLYKNENIHITENISIDIPEKITKYPECGVKNIAITTTGQYVPCLLLRDNIFNMGSVENENIENLVCKNNEDFKRVQNILSYSNLKPCNKCEVRYVCKGGGCKAINYLVNNKLEYRNPYYLNCYYIKE